MEANDQMNKWNEHIQFQLTDSSLVEKACILNKFTGQVWGCSTDSFRPFEYYYQVEGKRQNELNAITQLCHPDDTSHCIRLNKEKFHILRRLTNDSMTTIYARSSSSKSPLCLVATEKTITIALGHPNTSPGQLNSLVEELGTFFLKSEF